MLLQRPVAVVVADFLTSLHLPVVVYSLMLHVKNLAHIPLLSASPLKGMQIPQFFTKLIEDLTIKIPFQALLWQNSVVAAAVELLWRLLDCCCLFLLLFLALVRCIPCFLPQQRERREGERRRESSANPSCFGSTRREPTTKNPRCCQNSALEVTQSREKEER